MRVLLTGASGFVGGHVASALTGAGYELRLLARASSDLSRLGGLRYERVDRDLTAVEAAELGEACAGVGVVVHVAGLTASRERAAFRRVNALGTAALARAAAGEGVGRFLLLSSLAAQGPSLGGVAAAPGAARRPVSAYGRSKAEGEDAALLAGGEMVVQILRPPAVYGPGDRGLLPFFRMARWRYVVRMGAGENQVTMIYGPDLAEAVGALIAAPPGGSPFFHVSDAEGPYTWRELIVALGEAFGHRVWPVPVPGAAFSLAARGSEAVSRWGGGRPALDRSRAVEMRQRAWLADSAALHEATGWRARTSLGEGLRATLAWYRAQGWV